jgi:hypothetical protein
MKNSKNDKSKKRSCEHCQKSARWFREWLDEYYCDICLRDDISNRNIDPDEVVSVR